MKRHMRLFLILLMCLTVSLYLFGMTQLYRRSISMKQVDLSKIQNPQTDLGVLSKLKLEFAKTPEQKQSGLMHRPELCKDCGMLFVFESPSQLSFWMKNTWINLDIIFIDPEGKVINIESATAELFPRAKDNEYPVYRSSSSKALYVLEVNQGWSKENSLKVGDVLNIKSILAMEPLQKS
jgi:uncharacterized protein